ncbi:WD40 repeat-containing protein [Naegleria gruberi]|uniref:WD40 repeat-containing protein n=1 Tax=Naegleria gruberi TaxID=5762 RepID=D2UZ78_NAEGR|nr:WD40 repeat-containing protein [Naegleria gruberi]EFC50105.1 WD40 repeat-containing protein [Naegleria gruberi]|eukprot:XP_002682849.1 WD40 repeat-containing protein [Naegleria gruberi strain NEG-M]
MSIDTSTQAASSLTAAGSMSSATSNHTHLINPIYSKKQKARLVQIRTRNKRKLPLNESIIFHIFSFMNGADIESCCKASHIFQNVGNDESKFLEYFIARYEPYTTFYHDYNRQSFLISGGASAQPPPTPTTATTTTTTTTGGISSPTFPIAVKANVESPLAPSSPIITSTPLSPRGSVNSAQSQNSRIPPQLVSTPSFASFSTLSSVFEKGQPSSSNNQQQQQPQESIQREEREYYKRPRCNWRNAVKYREQMQTCYRFGQVNLMKVYTQPDLKILTLSSSSLKEAVKGKGWIDIENTNNTKVPSNPSTPSDSKISILNTSVEPSIKRREYVSDEEEVRKEKEKLDKERDRLVDEFSGIMNYCSTNTDDWKSNGFHLKDVRLLDGRVILNTRKNFRHTTKPFKHHFSYDLLTYSLFSAKDSHVANRLTGRRKQILDNMFEDDLPISAMKELHESLLSETDEFLYEQWVSKVMNCSSEYISRNRSEGGAASTTADDDLSTAHSRADYPPFSALNLIGVVNTYPKYGSFGTAWSPSNRTLGFGSLEFLEFEIEEEMFIEEVRVFETFCPGGVFKISIFDKSTNSWDTVWLGKPYDTNCRMMERSRVFAPTILKKDYPTKKIRIDLDLRKSPTGWTEIDGILVRGYLHFKDRLRVLASQQLQTKKDTISLNKEVLHFPYSYLSHSPFDYQFGVLCFVYTESSYYHINSTLVVIGGTELLKDEVFLEVTYSKDYIVAVKLLSNKTCMAIVKLARVPTQYCVHIYDISMKRLSKSFELKELPTDSKEVTSWELTQQVIACTVDKKIYVYDISNSTSMASWRLIYTLEGHDSIVTSMSLNTELIDLSNVLASSSSDKTVKIWSLHTGQCLMTLEHPSAVSCAKVIAAGTMVATCCVNESVIRIWSICGADAGALVRVLALPTLSTSNTRHTQKEIFFDESYFTYFEKGTNEYILGRFHIGEQDEKSEQKNETTKQETWVGDGENVILNRYNIVNKYQANAEACTIL